MLDDVQHLLDLASEQLTEIEDGYEASLAAHEVPGRLRALIKNFIENHRSALDFTAVATAQKYGVKKRKIYWPYSKTPTDFPTWIETALPGLLARHPSVAQAFERAQPYQPGREWMADLVALANGNKHNQLTPQTRTEQRAKRSGGVVWTEGVHFGSGVFINGERVDEATQRTPSTVDLIYVDWLFDSTKRSVLGTLRTINEGMDPMLHEFCSAVGI